MAPEKFCARKTRSMPLWITCCICFLCGSALFAADENDEVKKAASPTDAQSAESPEADAATKKLMAAHGLFQRGLFNLAAQQYADFLSEYPKHAQRTPALYALAVCQYRQDDYEKSALLLRAALRDPAFAQRDEALAVLGHCEWARKDYDASLAAFNELLAKHPTSKHAEAAALNRAQVLYAAGKPKDSADACRQFIEQHPKSEQKADALYVLGVSQRALNQYEEAAATFDRLAREYPRSSYAFDALLLGAQSLDATGKSDLAIAQYRRAASSAPPDRQGDVRYGLGVALEKSGKHTEAIAELSAAAAASGPYAKAARLQLASALLAAGKVAEARRSFNAVIEIDPDRSTDAHYGLAQCDIAEKRFDAARQTLGELLRQQPAPRNVAQIFLDRANCLVDQNQFEPAIAEYEKLAIEFPKAPQANDALYRQAYCLHRLKQFEKSHALCERFPQLPPSDLHASVAELDAQNLFLLGKYADASRAFEALSKDAKPDTKQLLMRLRMAQCAHFAGDYKASGQLLAPLAADPRVAADDQLSVAIFLLGDAELQLKDHRKAAEALAKFIALAKGDTAEAQFKLALALLGAGDTAAAERVLADLARASEVSPWVQRGLIEYAKICRKGEKRDLGLTAVRRVLAVKAPDDCAAAALYLSAWLDFDAKHFPQAAASWKTLVEKYPKEPLAIDAAFQRGVALQESAQFDEALATFESFAAAHPDSPNASIARQLAAACLAATGKTAEASARLASLAQAPSVTDAILYDLAWAQRGQKQNAAAMQTYRRLIQDYPVGKLTTAARAELGELLYNDQKYADAVELIQPALADAAADPKLILTGKYRLAWCYQKLRKFDKAAELFLKLGDAAKGDEAIAASSLLQAGLAYAELSKWEAADRALSQLVARFPEDPQLKFALLKLGEIRAERSDYEASAKAYATFIERFPKDAQVYRAHFGIGWSLENRKKFDEARAAYKQVIAQHNGETAARAQFQIGETFLAEQKFDQAIPALLAVDDVYAYPTWSARALLEAGRAFEQLKQLDQARKQYTQLIEKYREAPEAGMARERLKGIKG